MSNLAEVFLPQTEERGAVELRVAADEVICVRVELLAFVVAPRFFRVVLRFEIDGARAPVVLLTRNVIAALEKQDLLARGRETVSQRASARARADDDYVVVIVGGHGGAPIVT